MRLLRVLGFTGLAAALILSACTQAPQTPAPIYLSEWETLDTIGLPTARHEAAAAVHDGKLYLLGGRRINPVDMYDPETERWTEKSLPPLEIHHFQAVTVGDDIYIIGAMTGPFPNETPLEKVLIYSPETDRFKFGAEIPKERRRGGAGVVYHNGKIYVVGGITNGHMDGYVNWFDVYDPQTDEWMSLPDAPHERDHFQIAVHGNKLYAFAGRRSEWRNKLGFEQTVVPGDVYDFASGRWLEENTAFNLPTPRAGNMTVARNGHIIVVGGESGTQIEAHSEVEAFNPSTLTWSRLPDLREGRHGAGLVVVDDYLYAISGSGNRGGGPELTTIERLKLSPE